MTNTPLIVGSSHDDSDKRATLRYLELYIVETNPSLEDVAGVAGLLVEPKAVSSGSR